MRQDPIAQVEIRSDGRLYVVPTSASLPYIWREAMEVHWDPKRRALYAPPPREWSWARWLRQVLDAARTQGVDLQVTDDTRWIGVDAKDQDEMAQEARSPGGAR